MDNTVFSGNLNFLSLGDLLQLIGSNGSTGILHILSKYNEIPGLVHFFNGNPINATCGSKKGLDALYALFGWVEGEFEFSKERIQNKNIINKSRMEIILEGLRMLDDGLIEESGPISFEEETRDISGASAVPIIKGPLVDYMYIVDEEEFSDGEQIIRQGKHGNWIWVILDGVIEIRKEMLQDSVTILKIGAGSFVGSIAVFFMQANVRSATALAVGNVHLGVLDSQRLSREYACLSSEFKKILLGLDKRLKNTTDRTADIHIKKKMTESFIEKKKTFISQGDDQNNIYIIENGNAYVVRNTDTGDILLSKLGKGDFIGQIPFLNIGHEPHSASVVASDDLRVKELDIKSIQAEYNQLSTTFRNIVDNVATFVSATTSIACGGY